MRKTWYVFLTFGEANKNFDWIFRGAICKIQYEKVSYYNLNTIEIIEIFARLAKSETRESREDFLALIGVTNKYLVFKIDGILHCASLYTLWMRQTTPCFIHLRLFFRKLVSFFALETVDILCKTFLGFLDPAASKVSMFLVLKISKNCQFLTFLPPYKCLRNIWMVH